MVEVFKIVRENKKVEELLSILNDNSKEIKEIVVIVRSNAGDVDLLHAAGFETLCTGAKMLDYVIHEELDIDNTIEIELEEYTDEE